MKRRDFLSRFGIGAAAAVAAPAVVRAAVEAVASPEPVKFKHFKLPADDGGEITVSMVDMDYHGMYSKAEAEACFEIQRNMDVELFLGYGDKPITELTGIFKSLK